MTDTPENHTVIAPLSNLIIKCTWFQVRAGQTFTFLGMT